MPLTRKAINFDLNTKKLEILYPGKDWHSAYDDIKRHMIKNGFEHRQGSGYHSYGPMRDYEVIAIISDAYEKMPWLNECVRKLDMTSIGKTFDLAALLRKDKDEVSHDVKQNVQESFLERKIKSINQKGNKAELKNEKTQAKNHQFER